MKKVRLRRTGIWDFAGSADFTDFCGLTATFFDLPDRNFKKNLFDPLNPQNPKSPRSAKPNLPIPYHRSVW